MLRYILNTIIISAISIGSIAAANVDVLMSEANKSYTDGKFDEAAKAYESLVKQGYQSDILYYNLGNAYFKLKNIPASILNYERALLINPGDQNIKFNLDLARTFTVDHIEPLPEFFMTTFLKSIRKWMSTNGWAYTGIFFLICSLVLAYFFWFSYSPNIKRITFSVGILTLLFTLFSFTFSIQEKNSIMRHDYGILFPSVVAVKSSPGESGKDIFVLHGGTKVKIMDSVGDWFEIHTADGNIGWILKDTLERI